MAILGAHMSIAGGYHKAVEKAHLCGCDCVQFFTKNSNQWRAIHITRQQVRKFRMALEETGVSHPAAHDSYLINLASPVRELWRKSIDSFVVELHRADTLGIPHLIAHPGASTAWWDCSGSRPFTSTTAVAGLARG